MVSDNVDSSELQRILDFVQGAELESHAAGVYQVVKYRVSGNIGVFATTPQGRVAGGFLAALDRS